MYWSALQCTEVTFQSLCVLITLKWPWQPYEQEQSPLHISVTRGTTVNPPEGHSEDDSPRLVTNNKAILVEVQQLSFQQLGFTERRRVVTPGDHSSQHQHTAQHACHYKGPAFMS